MATPVQRIVAVSNALVNGVATADQIRRVGRGVAFRTGRLAEYDAGDNTVQATIFLEGITKDILSAVQDLESRTAVQDAAELARLKVNADFQSAP